MTSRGWVPFPFQETAWAAQRRGDSGLIQVPTGQGKTYAAYGHPLESLIKEAGCGIRILYLTPLRAMTRDLEMALTEPAGALDPAIRVESRTGDTPGTRRTRQNRKLPDVLLTTPESLSLLLTYANARELFAGLAFVIIDEWHELQVSKRGVQIELACARLRSWNPGLQTWALGATVPDPRTSALAACGIGSRPVCIQSPRKREIRIETLYPVPIEKAPWSGNLGLYNLETILQRLDTAKSCILFTNTRAQAELWHHAILAARPKWREILAIHHGSLAREEREKVEGGLKAGRIKVVVSTSSLDLGVDFAPVDLVFQIGSPKGVARLIQRAGRGRHRPGEEELDIFCVPTHALQMLEFAAARDAIARNEIEAPYRYEQPIDVLCQHLVSMALSASFKHGEMLAEVRGAHAYRKLAGESFDWCLHHLSRGGNTLTAYPEYHKLEEIQPGVFKTRQRFERMHRMSVGTIASDGMVEIRFTSGGRLGSVEESFLSRLKPGDSFVFAGRTLQLEKFREMVATVRLAKRKSANVPHYAGGRMPLSTRMAASLRRLFDQINAGTSRHPEIDAMKPILRRQAELSRIPSQDVLLIEHTRSREGEHLFVFPFAGRQVHEGLSAVCAFRLSRMQPDSFAISVNDYGFELVSSRKDILDRLRKSVEKGELFAKDRLDEDIVASLNLGEMSRRHFRTIARIAGLVFDGYPAKRKALRQLQSSAGLIYDVFRKFDPENRLLRQATEEVLQTRFDRKRMEKALERIHRCRIEIHETKRASPLAFPLMMDRLASKMSNETLTERVRRWQERMIKES